MDVQNLTIEANGIRCKDHIIKEEDIIRIRVQMKGGSTPMVRQESIKQYLQMFNKKPEESR